VTASTLTRSPIPPPPAAARCRSAASQTSRSNIGRLNLQAMVICTKHLSYERQRTGRHRSAEPLRIALRDGPCTPPAAEVFRRPRQRLEIDMGGHRRPGRVLQGIGQRCAVDGDWKVSPASLRIWPYHDQRRAVLVAGPLGRSCMDLGIGPPFNTSPTVAARHQRRQQHLEARGRFPAPALAARTPPAIVASELTTSFVTVLALDRLRDRQPFDFSFARSPRASGTASDAVMPRDVANNPTASPCFCFSRSPC